MIKTISEAKGLLLFVAGSLYMLAVVLIFWYAFMHGIRTIPPEPPIPTTAEEAAKLQKFPRSRQ